MKPARRVLRKAVQVAPVIRLKMMEALEVVVPLERLRMMQAGSPIQEVGVVGAATVVVVVGRNNLLAVAADLI